MDTNSCHHVNRKLLPIKVFYFCSLAATSALPPYLPLFFFHIGITMPEIAVIYGLLPFVGFFIRPAFGAIADKYHKHKVILIGSCIFMGLTHMLFLFAPMVGKPPSVNIACHGHVQEFDADSIKLLSSQVPLENGGTLKEKCKLACDISKSVQFCPDSWSDSNCVTNVTSGKFNLVLLKTFNLHAKRQGADLVTHPPIINSSMENDSFSYSVHNDTTDLLNITNVATVNYNDTTDLLLNITKVATLNYDGKGYDYMTCDESDTPIECHASCLPSPPFSLRFWFTLIISFITQIFINPVLSMSDGIAYANLGDQYEKWGNQRLWGTIGQILAATAAGFLMDSYGAGGLENVNYNNVFYLYAALCVLTTVSAYFVFIPKDMQCMQVMKSMGQLVRIPDVLVLLSVAFFMGIFLGLNMVYVFIFMDILKAPKYLMGILLAVSHIVECFMLFFAGHVIRRIGHIVCFHIGILAYALKLFSYGFITESWLLLVVEPLHAFAFALFYAAASALASKIAPMGLSATMQGLLGGVYFGLAMGVGSLIGGFIFKAFGNDVMWLTFGTAGFVLFVIYIIVYHAVLRKPLIERATPAQPKETDVGGAEQAEVEALNPVTSTTPDSETNKDVGPKQENEGDTTC